jgi:hypothetical protein
METTEKKKGSWTKLGEIATYTTANGKTVDFDFRKLSKEVLFFYGAKQWIADNGASAKTDDDRIADMKAAYSEAVEKGLELSDTGKVGIVGKVRSNATKTGELKQAKSMIELLMKKVNGEELTPEEETILAGMQERTKNGK